MFDSFTRTLNEIFHYVVPPREILIGSTCLDYHAASGVVEKFDIEEILKLSSEFSLAIANISMINPLVAGTFEDVVVLDWPYENIASVQNLVDLFGNIYREVGAFVRNALKCFT